MLGLSLLFPFKDFFIYLWLFWVFSSCDKRELLFIAVCGLPIAAASLVADTGSRCAGFSSCSSQALERCLSNCDARAQWSLGVWDLPGSGIEPLVCCIGRQIRESEPSAKPPGSYLKLLFQLVSTPSALAEEVGWGRGVSAKWR